MNKPKYQIGNYISTEYGELEIKNTAFGDYQVIGLDGRILWANEIDHILLTEKWLIKFGFKKDGNHLDLNGFSFLTFKGEVSLWSPSPRLIVPVVRYVHQLQNLYFCLTGEELKVNE